MWSWKNILASTWIIAVVAVVFVKGIIPGWQEGRSDFSNYYASAVLLSNGESISDFYDNDWFSEKAIDVGEMGGAKFAPFPPTTAFLYLPLVVLNPPQAKRAWLICNLLFLVILAFQLKAICNLTWFELIFILGLFCIPIASNIKLGQSYLLFTVFITSFIKGSIKGKQLLGPSLLGFAASLKYFPLVYLVYGLPAINKKHLFIFSIVVISSLILPVFLFGISPYQAFFGEFWNHLNGNLSGQGQFSVTFQSIDVLLANLFIYDLEQNPMVWIDAPYLKAVIKIVFALVIIFFSAQSLKTGVKKTKELSLGILVIGASLLIPASATYHFLFLIPALLLALAWLKDHEISKKIITGVIVLVFFICNLLAHNIPGIQSYYVLNVLVHFPRLFGLLMLFILLIVVQKRYLRENV